MPVVDTGATHSFACPSQLIDQLGLRRIETKASQDGRADSSSFGVYEPGAS